MPVGPVWANNEPTHSLPAPDAMFRPPRAETRLASAANGGDGTPITDSEVAQLLPEGFIRALIHDAHGKPINASGKQRHPTTRQKRVVKERDRCCVDCGSNDLHEFDHDPAFEQTGHTIVDELKVRCAPCHRRRHRGAV
jgi:hypothetical protein